MDTATFIIVMVLLLIVSFFILPRWRLKRATRQVIRSFREHNATNIKNTKTINELGLSPRGMIDGLFKGRDYKPYAIKMMIRAEIIKETEDGKFYLSEDRLYASGFEKGQHSPYNIG